MHLAQGPAVKGKPSKDQSAPPHLPVRGLAKNPLGMYTVMGSHFPFRQKKEHFCVFHRMGTSAIEKTITPALQLSESVQEGNKDPLTQAARKSSFALEGREAGNKL